MNVLDFNGQCQLYSDDALVARLRSVRRGMDGAFVLDHGTDESLWVHFHGDSAFVWFTPDKDGKHPGFVPEGMWLGEQRDIRFLQVNGSDADSIVVPWWQLLTVDAACRAAVEFLHSSKLPSSVSWCEL